MTWRWRFKDPQTRTHYENNSLRDIFRKMFRGQKNRPRKKNKFLGREVPRNFSDQCSLDFAYFLCLFSGRRSKSSQELCSWELFFLILGGFSSCEKCLGEFAPSKISGCDWNSHIQECRALVGPKSPKSLKRSSQGSPPGGSNKCRKSPKGPKKESKRCLCQNQLSGTFSILFPSKNPSLGNGQTTVSRVISEERTHRVRDKLGEFCDNLGEFAFAHKY